MRIHVLSDLHLEFGPFSMPKVEADVVVLAGDTQPDLTSAPVQHYSAPAMIVRVLKIVLEALKNSGPRDSFN